MREPFFTYESKPLDELLAELKNSRLAVAIVLDEYGGTSGMITTEDIVEEIVGEIGDEYDDEEDEIEVIKDNEFVVDGAPVWRISMKLSVPSWKARKWIPLQGIFFSF